MRLSVQPSTDPSGYPFTHPIRVRFAETDAMSIVHHSVYPVYLEEARVAYLSAVGQPYTQLHDSGFDMTVLEVWVGYRRPLRFDEVVDVAVAIAEVTRTTLQIAYCLTVGGALRATAVTIHGCVDREGKPRRLPEWLRPG
ncbi:MAG TPA: thioesterase family protein [Acidimicrobiales bacterium]|jgi:acyl-CoA thioester hydrolase|nr:thioesterase family protein [Acidimicrobiales bacterium]